MSDDKALEHAWKYFALHASQRMAIFNYFVVFAGVLCTGIAAALQSTAQTAMVGIALGGLLTLLSFVFYKLEQRTSYLIKLAEEPIRRLEPPAAALVAGEDAATAVARRDAQMWTYGKSFRTVFCTMALVGAGGATLSLLKALNILHRSPYAGISVRNSVCASGSCETMAPLLPRLSGSVLGPERGPPRSVDSPVRCTGKSGGGPPQRKQLAEQANLHDKCVTM